MTTVTLTKEEHGFSPRLFIHRAARWNGQSLVYDGGQTEIVCQTHNCLGIVGNRCLQGHIDNLQGQLFSQGALIRSLESRLKDLEISCTKGGMP